MTDVDSPERALFASTAQAFLDKEASLSRVRELHAKNLSFDRAWWQRAAELGWASLLVAEELGRRSVSGNGVADLALIAERSAEPSRRGRCTRSAQCWPGWSTPTTSARSSSTASNSATTRWWVT